MDNANLRELIGRYLVAYNSFDVDGMLALFSADIRFENYSSDRLTATANGIDAFRQLAESSRSLFSAREQRLTGLQCAGDSAIAHIAYRGVLAADIPDGPPAGTVIELQGRSEFSFEGGRITRLVDRS